MRFAIDVAHLDRTATVVRVASLPPGRLGAWVWRARGVLEAEQGAFAAWGLGVRDHVALADPGAGSTGDRSA